MLTLQQLLESDSLSTIVAKLNQNFQTLSLSNGGPQGIRVDFQESKDRKEPRDPQDLPQVVSASFLLLV